MGYWKKCKVSKFTVRGENVFKLTAFQENASTLAIGSDIKWLYLTDDTYRLLLISGDTNLLTGKVTPDVLRFLKYGPFDSHNIPKDADAFVQKAFVTNAVANSVAKYAWVYINNELNLSSHKIIALRRKYSLDNVSTDRFTFKELLSSFVNQSAFFLNLVGHMHEDDRFQRMVERMENEDKDNFRNCFGSYKDADELNTKYRDRRIFHWLLECDSMRSNYKEADVFHANTRVFTENKLFADQKFITSGYLVSTKYLEELQMRVCKNCQDWNNFL